MNFFALFFGAIFAYPQIWNYNGGAERNGTAELVTEMLTNTFAGSPKSAVRFWKPILETYFGKNIKEGSSLLRDELIRELRARIKLPIIDF